jgi:hypothetical protein
VNELSDQTEELGAAKSFRIALRLLWVAWGLRCWGFVLYLPILFFWLRSAAVFAVVVHVGVAACIWFIGRRKNWARITYSAVFIIGAPSLLTFMSLLPTELFFLGLLGISEFACQLAALVLVWRKTGSEWT